MADEPLKAIGRALWWNNGQDYVALITCISTFKEKGFKIMRVIISNCETSVTHSFMVPVTYAANQFTKADASEALLRAFDMALKQKKWVAIIPNTEPKIDMVIV